MKKRAIYPGSFNPWHKGHSDILRKALDVFDEVIVAIGRNPDKSGDPEQGGVNVQAAAEGLLLNSVLRLEFPDTTSITVKIFDGLLVNFAPKWGVQNIIRGLRSGYDLDYEAQQMYWHEDLAELYGQPPLNFIYFMCDRGLSHVSSSAIRGIQSFDPDFQPPLGNGG